jgi:hypothetical protein
VLLDILALILGKGPPPISVDLCDIRRHNGSLVTIRRAWAKSTTYSNLLLPDHAYVLLYEDVGTSRCSVLILARGVRRGRFIQVTGNVSNGTLINVTIITLSR